MDSDTFLSFKYIDSSTVCSDPNPSLSVHTEATDYFVVQTVLIVWNRGIAQCGEQRWFTTDKVDPSSPCPYPNIIKRILEYTSGTCIRKTSVISTLLYIFKRNLLWREEHTLFKV